MELVKLRRIHHRDKARLAMFFEKGARLEKVVRNINGVKFSITHRCWYVEDTSENLDVVLRALSGIASVEQSEQTSSQQSNESVSASMVQKPQQLSPLLQRSTDDEVVDSSVDRVVGKNNEILFQIERKLKLHGYSGATVDTYISQFRQFLIYMAGKDIRAASQDEIRRYLLNMINRRKASRSTQNQAINAIKFYYEKVLGRPRATYYLERPMKEYRLPGILSEDEISRIFSAIANTKHKLMLMVIYSGGLRRSELLNLKVGDVDRERCTIFIRGGKGRKDRTTMLAKRLFETIERYLSDYKPSHWMFEGVHGSKYSATSLQQVFGRALRKSGIAKEASLHTLRHSFATHLLESGASTLYIQKLLGHESSKTTEIYAQVTKFGLDKIKSPFDGDAFEATGK